MAQARFYIDARGQQVQFGGRQDGFYAIPNLADPQVWQRVQAGLSGLVYELAFLPGPPQLLRVSYDPQRLSPGYIEYLLQQQGLTCRRQG